jgi:hypothetical protein
MAAEHTRVLVTSNTELVDLLAKASHGPVILDNHGDLYRLDHLEGEPEDLWAGYDPKAVRAAIKQTAGSWSELDADKLIEQISRAREEGTRGASRP